MPQQSQSPEGGQDETEREVAAAAPVREGPGSARTGAILSSSGHVVAILGSSGGAWRSEMGRWIAAANSPSATLSHHIAS